MVYASRLTASSPSGFLTAFTMTYTFVETLRATSDMRYFPLFPTSDVARHWALVETSIETITS